jgi:hypothetical protein
VKTSLPKLKNVSILQLLTKDERKHKAWGQFFTLKVILYNKEYFSDSETVTPKADSYGAGKHSVSGAGCAI